MDTTHAALSRRSFVAGTVATCVATTSSLSRPLEASAQTSVPESWDAEADFVVLGSGTALTGALQALLEGLSVIVVEKASTIGGTTAWSGGQVWVPFNRYSKNPDDRETARTYMMRCADGLVEDELVDAYLDACNEMAEMVASETDVEWSVSSRADYHSNWEGASVDARSLAYYIDGTNLGRYTTDAEADRIEELGGQFMLETAAKRLVVRPLEDGRFEVLGVIAEDATGTDIAIKAKKGVLIGTGGYARNLDMLKKYLPLVPHYTMSVPEDTGDGIRMGQAIGCDLNMMGYIWGEASLLDMTPEECEAGVHLASFHIYEYNARPSSIFVDRNGKRFMVESCDYDSLYMGLLGQYTGGDMEFRYCPAYYICDQKVRDTMGSTFFRVEPDEEVPAWAVQADTIEELAEKLGIDPAGLAAQVEKWNEDCASGVDTELHRGEMEYEVHNKYVQPGQPPIAALDTPPFYGAVIMPASMATKGGIKINEHAQAMHVSGDIVPRLYASGNATGAGSPGRYYTGAGATLGAGMVFSYLAAKDVATLEDWA